jgi:hypothetical protein
MIAYSLVICLVLLCCLIIIKATSIVFSGNKIFLKPLWGIGNRLRTIRKTYALAKKLNKELVIIEHVDDGLKVSMKRLFGVRLLHMPLFVFLLLYKRSCVNFKYNNQCTFEGDLSVFEKVGRRNIYIEACEMNVSGVDMNDRSIYDSWKPYVDHKSSSLMRKIKSHKHVVGVHIRQGNVNDWSRGYFFNDEWKDIKNREPDSAPHFCCYDSKSKNLSSCTSNVQTLDGFIERMKTFPKDTCFFVCSDRVGCMIHLHQLFPGRIISNDVEMETTVLDIYKSMQDFLCLSECNEMIVSNVSSFSVEARTIHDIPMHRLTNKKNATPASDNKSP